MNKYEIKLNENEYVDVKYEDLGDDSNCITILSNDIGTLKNAYIKTPEGEKKYTRKIKCKEELKVVLKATDMYKSTHNIPA